MAAEDEKSAGFRFDLVRKTMSGRTNDWMEGGRDFSCVDERGCLALQRGEMVVIVGQKENNQPALERAGEFCGGLQGLFRQRRSVVKHHDGPVGRKGALHQQNRFGSMDGRVVSS